MEQAQFQCRICSILFSRPAHLRRHHLSCHLDETFSCSFCGAVFKRRDTLRRHWKGCVARRSVGASIPEHKQPGRKKQACDHCADFKQACEGQYPCQRCQDRGLDCSINRLGRRLNQIAPVGQVPTNTDANQPLSNQIQDLDWEAELADLPLLDTSLWDEYSTYTVMACGFGDALMPHKQLPFTGFDTDTIGWEVFDFLWNFTASPGLNNTFNYLTWKDRKGYNGSLNISLPTSSDPCLIFSEPTNNSVQPENKYADFTSVTIKWIFHPLLSRAKEIWEALSSISARYDKQLLTNSKEEIFDKACVQFLNPVNIERFLDLYWTRWHSNWPVIHKPTFDINNSPVLLLLVMALTGALMSSDPEDLENARKWLTPTERLVFRDPWLSGEDMSDTEKQYPDLQRLRLLQTAMLICILQIWEGTDTARRRIRQRRYNSVIHTLRAMGLSRNAYANTSGSNELSDWEDFIFKEGITRTETFTMLLDTAFTIFYNVPARVAVTELNLPLTQPDIYFEAADSESYRKLVNTRAPRFSTSAGFSATDVVHKVCNGCSAEDLVKYYNLTDLNLFMIISAILILISYQEMSYVVFPTTVSAFRTAIRNWRILWENRLERPNKDIEFGPAHETTGNHPAGFVRNAFEFYMLALAKLKYIETRHEKTPPLDEPSMDRVRNLMLQTRDILAAEL
ncbi:hypothetical protein F5884DRAFT_776811 [Xylogone sp. PMI_703]|nr:hypothetical protein F5884DRAFT_776811 [Xylogone sp. PMI_703]